MNHISETFHVIYKGLFSVEARKDIKDITAAMQRDLECMFPERAIAEEHELDADNGWLTTEGYKTAHNRTLRMQAWTPFAWWLVGWFNQAHNVIENVSCIWIGHELDGSFCLRCCSNIK